MQSKPATQYKRRKAVETIIMTPHVILPNEINRALYLVINKLVNRDFPQRSYFLVVKFNKMIFPKQNQTVKPIMVECDL